MSVASNSSEEEIVGGVKLYQGIAPVRVIAVNPSKTKLESLGINMREEPKYRNVSLGANTANKLVFWLQYAGEDADPFFARIEILVNPNVRQNKDKTKSQWVNNFGTFGWAAGPASQTYNWFKADGEREAYEGEETFISFIKAWANVSNDDNCYFETIDQIISLQDISELENYVDSLSDNAFRVLLGVKDNKYQQVYPKHFGRLKPNRPDLFQKSLSGEYGDWKDVVYPEDFAFGPYEYSIPKADSTTDAAAGVTEGADDDYAWLNKD